MSEIRCYSSDEVYDAVMKAAEMIRAAGVPAPTEPIKLTPGQWAILPHGVPTPYPLYKPLGDLMGIPVVMVNTEEESTPVVEGWIKPKRPKSRRERRKRLGLRWWQRSMP